MEWKRSRRIDGKIDRKVRKRRRILPLFLGRRKAGPTSTRTSVPTPAPRPREEATENFLHKLFLPWRKRRPPPPILIPPAIFVSSPEETEAVLAMDARRHHASRRASEMYNVDPEEDLDFPSEESYPGMYQDRFFSEPFEEGWTTVGEVTIAMDRHSPDPRTDRASSPSRLSASPPPATRSPKKRLQLNIASTNTALANATYPEPLPSGGKEPRQDTQSTKKAEGSWRSPFSSPKKSQESRLARAAVESSPKKSPKNSPKSSPKKVKGVAAFSSPQCGRRVLPEILESSVHQYRPVYNTPPLDNTNLVPKPYCSRYSASLTSPPYRGPVASPRTILPKPGATPSTESNGGEAAAVSQRQPKDTKGKIKRSMPSPEACLEGCGKTSRTSSPRSLSPTSPTSPITRPGMDSIYSRPLTRSPLTTGKTSKSPINNKTPSPIASPLGSPVTSSGLSPTTSPSLSPTPSPKFSPVTTPPPSKRGQSPPFLQPLSPPSSPDNKESLSDSTDLDPEEFLALSTLDSALLDTPSLYNCSNKPFNSYEELQTMTEKEQKSSVSAPTPTTAAAARPSNQTKTSEYSGDVDSGGSRHPSEAMDTTLSRDSLNTTISDEMKSLRSFVAQEELSTPPASQGPKNQREESLEFVFEEVTDSPCHLPREHVPAPAKSPAGGSLATGEKKPSRLSPKLGKFTQKVSDKNKENEEKNKISPFLPRNILHFGSKDKKAKAKAHETDSPKTEGWTSEAIEEYLLETSREESVKLGLLTEEDIMYHESKGGHQTSSASRPLPEVTVSDELQPVAPFRRRAAPSPPQSRSPSWNPQDIENYLLEHNKDENLRLGLLSKEDIDIYEWKRATGMSPICDTSWTRETLRKNKWCTPASLPSLAQPPSQPPRIPAPLLRGSLHLPCPQEPKPTFSGSLANQAEKSLSTFPASQSLFLDDECEHQRRPSEHHLLPNLLLQHPPPRTTAS
ncbi:nascent polypeptide-associated complex subunit alpha, muscle-specific form-like isoform X2 [Portunus trituberculatus]|uniref:nascent polypeptide-associated complex subunit alpha, muscle-specific form-like isoform X2 n=1 Tax=Portunus trituberculatus TaxID=210409 RepID=UPI001E1CED8D|nr:nascent polypeptide-associated complex subunit alpha, muscle-specific form-like isoform X2 [Portunus trituberculatus]